jgi:hypothetical protein
MTETIPHTPARTLHDICEAARQVPCGWCCAYSPAEACGFTGTTTHPLDGWHVARFARARREGLITEADMSVVLEAAGDVFTNATIIWVGAR